MPWSFPRLGTQGDGLGSTRGQTGNDRFPSHPPVFDDRIRVGDRATAAGEPPERQAALRLGTAVARWRQRAGEQRHSGGRVPFHCGSAGLLRTHRVRRDRRALVRRSPGACLAATRVDQGHRARRDLHGEPHPGARRSPRRLPLHRPLGQPCELCREFSGNRRDGRDLRGRPQPVHMRRRDGGGRHDAAPYRRPARRGSGGPDFRTDAARQDPPRRHAAERGDPAAAGDRAARPAGRHQADADDDRAARSTF